MDITQIRPTGDIIGHVAVTTFIIIAMTMNLPFFGSFTPFSKIKITEEYSSMWRTVPIMITYLIRFTVLAMMWASVGMWINFSNHVISNTNDTSSEYNRTKIDVFYTRFNVSAWTTLATLILFNKLISDLLFEMIGKPQMKKEAENTRKKGEKMVRVLKINIENIAKYDANAVARLQRRNTNLTESQALTMAQKERISQAITRMKEKNITVGDTIDMGALLGWDENEGNIDMLAAFTQEDILAALLNEEDKLVTATTFPYYNGQQGVISNFFNLTIFLMLTFPIITNIMYSWGMFRYLPSGEVTYEDINGDTNAPVIGYRIAHTIAQSVIVFIILVHAFVELIWGYDVIEYAGKPINQAVYAGNNALQNINDWRLGKSDASLGLLSIFEYRGARHQIGPRVDGVEHRNIYGKADGAIMLFPIGHWLLFLIVLSLVYTNILFFRNYIQVLAYVLSCVVVPVFFARAMGTSKAFLEPLVWANSLFFIHQIVFHAWGFQLKISANPWDPANGWNCPEPYEKFCFLTAFNYYGSKSYADVTNILLGIEWTYLIVTIFFVVSCVRFFVYGNGVKDVNMLKQRMANVGLSTKID